MKDGIRSAAKARKNKFLKEHGKHEWQKHDVLEETKEELADAWNYIEAYGEMSQEDVLQTLSSLKWLWNNVVALQEKRDGINR